MNGKRLVSKGWSLANRAARWSYRAGLRESVRLPCRVVSVGNLQVGGSGKTPLVIHLAREAVARGLQVAILTRGYASAWERDGGTILPSDANVSPYLCGDEAALIHERVPEAWIGVGRDRVRSFERLVATTEVRGERSFDVVILDDGLQHFRIERDLNVVAMTDADRDRMIFREDAGALSSTDFLVLTKGNEFPPGTPAGNPKAKIEYRFPEPAAGTRFALVCGLGDPERTRALLEAAGYAIEQMMSFPDHHPYALVEVERILREAEGLGLRVLITGKDAVKWLNLGVRREQVDVVEPEIAFREGEALFRERVWGRG